MRTGRIATHKRQPADSRHNRERKQSALRTVESGGRLAFGVETSTQASTGSSLIGGVVGLRGFAAYVPLGRSDHQPGPENGAETGRRLGALGAHRGQG